MGDRSGGHGREHRIAGGSVQPGEEQANAGGAVVERRPERAEGELLAAAELLEHRAVPVAALPLPDRVADQARADLGGDAAEGGGGVAR